MFLTFFAKMKILLIFAVSSFISLVLAERQRYDGYQVWKTNIDASQFKLLLQWESERWVEVKGQEVLVSPDDILKVHSMFEENDIKYSIRSENFQSELDNIWERIDSKRAYDPNEYNTYEDIIDEINRLADDECPEGFECTTYSIGQTLEERDIVVFSITQGSDRQALWFDSLCHAREWMSGATLMRVLDQFVTGYGNDEDATYVLDNYDIYVLPVFNPDGYVYTFTDNIMWRKNRNPNEGALCMGVDNNRNFDWNWSQEPGASSNPCAQDYYGTAINSELETIAVSNEISSLSSRLVAMTSIHTFVPAWLTPHSDCTYPPNIDDVMRVAGAAVQAIEATHNTTWLLGSSCEILYPGSGVLLDWATSIGIPYTSTPEMRGPGFFPPTSDIQPSFEEMYNGFVAMVREIDEIKQEKSQ